MDPSNENPNSHYYTIDPLQFCISVPHSNPTSNTNPISSSSSTSNPYIDYNSVVSSYENSNSISYTNLNDFLAMPVPRKRRRGRPPKTAPSMPLQDQVNHFHYYGSSSMTLCNGQPSPLFSSPAQVVRQTESNFSNSSSSNPNSFAPDVSDEIIVINKESTAEALVALTAGFPADSLTDEEIEAGVVSVVGGIEQVNYIIIRNHIITKWRENVMNWITKDMFVNIVPSHCSALLNNAYNYLVSHGYINFGVAPAIKEKILTEPIKQNVIVIGAGLAGLAAARQLMSFGFKVTVLEGRKRAGGRVYTKKMEGGNKIAAADLGGSVLTGTHGNPLGILARQLSYPLHKVRDKCPIYGVDGRPVDPVMDSKVETAFNRLLDQASKLRQLMGEVSQDVSLGAALETFRQVYGDAVNAEEMNMFNWHLANLEYANAGLLSKLSLAFWDQDDPYDMGGDHCFLPGGNGRLVQALIENVPILYERTVHTIRYGSDGVQVIAGGQIFEGEMALCTVPLGVLKNGAIKFIPELPQRKLDGIKRLGFGLLNKVAMLFPYVFWGTDIDTFGHLSEDSSRRGEFFLFYSYATVAGGPLLIALVAGEAAHHFESMPPTDAVTKVLQILKGIYGPKGIDVPEPIQTVCTRWGSDPFSLGSYSNVAVGASGDDYDILAENVGDGRLFFAGEATTRRYPATMHGAFLSGLREASNMAHNARVRAMRIKVEKNPSKNAHSCASILADLFREPDLEFGSFSVIFGRKNSDLQLPAILRVAFSGSSKKSQEYGKPGQQHSNKLLFQQLQSHFNQQQELHVYTLISKQQALELREVRGGDEMRLDHLCEKLGVKLFGRKGLGPSADSVIASIKVERGKRKPASNSSTLKPGTSKPKMITLKQKPLRKAKVLGNANGFASARSRDMGVKVVGNNSYTPPPNLNVGAKVTGNSNGSSPSPNLSFGAKLMGNSNGSTPPPNLSVGAKVMGNSNGSTPPPNLSVGSANVVGNSNGNSFTPPNLYVDPKVVCGTSGLIPHNWNVDTGSVSSSSSPSIPLSFNMGTDGISNNCDPSVLHNSNARTSLIGNSSDFIHLVNLDEGGVHGSAPISISSVEIGKQTEEMLQQ